MQKLLIICPHYIIFFANDQDKIFSLSKCQFSGDILLFKHGKFNAFTLTTS
ncbi:MAG: hypothetical protein RLZZ176_3151 [Cyanobacteriota bacterium]